jgi:thiamine-phosphate pyrophosphorylase
VIVLVTDPRYSLDHTLRTISLVREVLADEQLIVQHRDKVSPPEGRERAARAILATGARTVLNGTAEEALRLGAFGVHLPGDDADAGGARTLLGDRAWISIPAHDDAAIERALAGRATAALVSPIYDAEGKGPGRGVQVLTRARSLSDSSASSASRLRIIALGGIDSRRAASCARAGADGIAVIRAIFDAPDPAAAALELTRQFTCRP